MAFKLSKSGAIGSAIGAAGGFPVLGGLVGESTRTSKNVSTANKYLDPGDLFGAQSKERRAELEKSMASDRELLDKLMGERPSWELSKWETKSNLPEFQKQLGQVKTSIGPGGMYQTGAQDIASLRERAFGEGESPWLSNLLEQQRLEEQTGLEDLTRQQALSQAQAEAQLASSGGLEGGSRERLATQMGRSQMEQLQQAKRQGQAQRLGLRGDEEARRMELQQQLPSMQLGYDQYRTGLNEANRQAALQKTGMWGQMAQSEAQRLSQAQQQKQLADLSAWQEKMRAVGSGREADYLARMSSPTGSILERMI